MQARVLVGAVRQCVHQARVQRSEPRWPQIGALLGSLRDDPHLGGGCALGPPEKLLDVATRRTEETSVGVRIGRQGVYLAAMLKPAPRATRALLWAIQAGAESVPAMPPGDALSLTLDRALPRAFYEAVGYRVVGRLALRLDAVERILALAGKLSRIGPFTPSAEMAALADCDVEDMGGVLGGLGFRAEAPDAHGIVFYHPPAKVRRDRKRRRKPANPCSPFAKLASLRASAS